MILGVDHLALSCADLAAALSAIRAAGYTVQFMHERLPNSATKRPFLSVYEPVHAMAYCRPQRGAALELTQHAAPLKEQASFYQVLLKTPPSGTTPFRGTPPCSLRLWNVALNTAGAQAVIWAPFGAQCWRMDAPTSDAGSCVRAVAMPAVQLKRSVMFWTQGLGCRLIARGAERGRGWVHLSFRAAISAWSLEFILVEAGGVRRPNLDAAGFPCLAFLSTDLAGDRRRLREQGAAEIGEASSHEINGKRLRMIIARGPSEEIVELIEFDHRSSRTRPRRAVAQQAAGVR